MDKGENLNSVRMSARILKSRSRILRSFDVTVIVRTFGPSGKSIVSKVPSITVLPPGATGSLFGMRAVHPHCARTSSNTNGAEPTVFRLNFRSITCPRLTTPKSMISSSRAIIGAPQAVLERTDSASHARRQCRFTVSPWRRQPLSGPSDDLLVGHPQRLKQAGPRALRVTFKLPSPRTKIRPTTLRIALFIANSLQTGVRRCNGPTQLGPKWPRLYAPPPNWSSAAGSQGFQVAPKGRRSDNTHC